MSKSVLIPKIRFNGFSDEWQEHRLGNVSKPITKGTTPSAFINSGIKFIKIEALNGLNIVSDKCLYIPKSVHENELKRSKLQEGDILFAIAGATIGKFGIVTKEVLPANTNQALAIIRLKDIRQMGFLLQTLFSKSMKKYIYQNISVGAQPNLNLKQMGDYRYLAPSLPEQKKIADFLSTVDKKIQALNKKKELLQSYKKGLMQKIFRQEIRFKQDDGGDYPEWVEMRLGNVGKVSMCKRIMKHQTSISGDIPFYKIGTFGKQPDAFIDLALYESFKEKYPFPEQGEILISASGTIGRTVIFDGKPSYFQDSNIVWLRNNEDLLLNKFLYYCYHNVRWNTENTTIARLYNDNFRRIVVPLPSKKEQTKIANFLTSIDDKINVVSSQIDKMKEWKKGLLQQMFV